MKIIQLTPGTGNFHCGSCLRDHALVSAMRQKDVDAQMLAMYLPHVLDEPEQAPDSVFFGGINVYLQHKLKLFRHTPRWIDKLFDSRKMLNMASKRAGMTKASELGEMTIAMLNGESGPQNKELSRLIEHLQNTGKPDIVMLSNVMLVGMAKRLKAELGAPVICTLHGEDGFLDSLPDSHRDEAWQLLAKRCADVDRFVAVSEYYGSVMQQRLALPAEKLRVVHNGIDVQGFPTAQPSAEKPVVGYLARMCHAKGLHTLVDAFIKLHELQPDLNAQLCVMGAMTAIDEPYVEQQKSKLKAAALLDRVTFEPNVSRDRKFELLKTFSVLSVPATYGESFGLYLLEAMACGIPCVQPEHGAFGELLAATGGGILCLPDDAESLADSLAHLLTDEDHRKALGDAGKAAVHERFTNDQMAENVLSICKELAD